MLDFLRQLFDVAGFVPRRSCGNWTSALILLHNVSDGVIWFSYMAIPCVLIYFIRKRRDFPFPRVLWMFGAFIILCGFTHLLDIVMFTTPMYRFSGLVKLATAGVSLATVAALVPLVPQALALRSPKELDAINGRLAGEIAERRRTEEFARSITQAASDAIISADDRGNVVSWNRGAETIFGHSSTEIVGQSLARLMPERFRDAHRLGFDRVAEGGEGRVLGQTLELQGLRKNGEEFALELRVDAWSSTGRRFFTGIVRDITERRRRIDEIEALNRELEAFSYSVSHDLRAPLRAINGFSSILLEDHASQLDPEGGRLLRVVADSAERMGRLIDDLLEFSRTGRASLRCVAIDMRELASSVLRQLLTECHGRDIDAHVLELPAATGDPSLLRQVFVNLIGNAIKYTGTRSHATIEIGVTAAKSTLTSADSNGPVYWVRDNGVGFDMKYVHKLFGVFQRLHSSEEFAGTGVGLALVRRIVHRHGGNAWAEAVAGEGATFSFTLGRGPLAATD